MKKNRFSVAGSRPGVTVMRRAALIALFLLAVPGPAFSQWTLPKNLPPDEYGTVLINRTSEKKGVKPAVFSHWAHRRKHTCRVCHFELEFNFKVNTTEITEAANMAGQFCGSAGCHDGVTVFGHQKPHCDRCHNGSPAANSELFASLAKYPKDRYGNGVDWVKALNERVISPMTRLAIPPADMSFDKRLVLEAEQLHGIPPAVFPHREHIAWLDCNNCHPDIFNIKKKTTKHFAMVRIMRGEFCGVCHLTVAFPMDDCKRCHPKKK
jgi:c(7)-type cytochrome triheme protein